jgi:hypothetical protein
MFNEPGPRGSTDERRAPRGPGSGTIDEPIRPSPLIGKSLAGLSEFSLNTSTMITAGVLLLLASPALGLLLLLTAAFPTLRRIRPVLKRAAMISLFLGFAGLFGGLVRSCGSESYEVARVASPEGDVDAVVFEQSGGATVALPLYVELQSRHRVLPGGDLVATIFGPAGKNHPCGVSPRWKTKDFLVIDYEDADWVRLDESSIEVAGHRISVTLQSGVTTPWDPGACRRYNPPHDGEVREDAK